MEPGVRAPLDQTYFKRIEAIEFAVRTPTGRGRPRRGAHPPAGGVSRTSKPPLSTYPGYLGHKAANVPIVRGGGPSGTPLRDRPGQDRAPRRIHPERLVEIGEERVRSMGGPRRRYADLEVVFEEL